MGLSTTFHSHRSFLTRISFNRIYQVAETLRELGKCVRAGGGRKKTHPEEGEVKRAEPQEETGQNQASGCGLPPAKEEQREQAPKIPTNQLEDRKTGETQKYPRPREETTRNPQHPDTAGVQCYALETPNPAPAKVAVVIQYQGTSKQALKPLDLKATAIPYRSQEICRLSPSRPKEAKMFKLQRYPG